MRTRAELERARCRRHGAILNMWLASAGLVAAGCGWPFGTDTTCEDQANCAAASKPDSGGSGGASIDGSTGGGSGTNSGGSGGVSGTGGSGGNAGTGGRIGDAGGADGGDADATPPCDGTASPSTDVCVIDERFGIFVSPTGSDTSGDGSRLHPFATLAQAMGAASQQKRRIYACADGGAYTETIKLNASLDGLSYFGGFHCADWTYDTALKSKLTSADTTAWSATGLTQGLTIENFDIASADATTAGTSSIAVIVAQSQNVVLRQVTVKAGNGADGADGATGAQGADGDVVGSDQVGKAALCTGAPTQQLGGAWTDVSSCKSQGGSGGTATKNANGSDGNPGTPDTDVTPPGHNNSGMGATASGPGGDGTIGADGNPGTNGKPALPAGAFSAVGYAAANGQDGTDGFPGQGGGGGGASKGSTSCVGASGGAGGMGGCNGTHGTGGTGGGASVALFVWQSTVRIDGATLVAAKGGNGGRGGNSGQGGIHGDGASGGNPALADGIGGGGHGGAGGDGGNAGSGSGGTGGPSYALFVKGNGLTKQGTITLTKGIAGTKGTGGFVNGSLGTNAAPNGTDGAAAPELDVP